MAHYDLKIWAPQTHTALFPCPARLHQQILWGCRALTILRNGGEEGKSNTKLMAWCLACCRRKPNYTFPIQLPSSQVTQLQHTAAHSSFPITRWSEVLLFPANRHRYQRGVFPNCSNFIYEQKAKIEK